MKGQRIQSRCFDEPHRLHFESRIQKIIPLEEDRYGVILDRTWFFPGGGGQARDRGTLDGTPILDIRTHRGSILHILDHAPSGQQAECHIDGEFRRDMMEQHTGQHIISAVLWHAGKYTTLSVHLGRETTDIEIDTPRLDEKTLEKIEESTWVLIRENRRILRSLLSPSAAGKLPLRKPCPLDQGPVQVISIEDVDHVCCCGFHLSRTGAVMLAKLVGLETIRHHVRLKWKIGTRAFRDYERKHHLVSDLQRRFETDDSQIITSTEHLMESFSRQKGDLRRLEKTLAGYLAQQMKEKARRDSSSSITRIFRDLSAHVIKEFAKQLVSPPRFYFCILYDTGDSWAWWMGGPAGGGFPFGEIRRELLSPLGGRGGGKGPLFSGMIPHLKHPEEFLSSFQRIIEPRGPKTATNDPDTT